MIRLYLLGGAAIAFATVLAALWWQVERNAQLRDEIARHERNAAVLSDSLSQARMALHVAAAREKRAQEMTAKANATIEKIRNLDLGECADAQLDPDLADLLGGVPADD